MDKGKQAFRSGYQTVIDPETLSIKDEAAQAQEDMRAESERENAAYASLKGHPGWELIRKDFEHTIATYRSGRAIAHAIARGDSNRKIGELTRTSNAIADELERKVLTVEGAALALEEDNGPKRTKSKRV